MFLIVAILFSSKCCYKAFLSFNFSQITNAEITGALRGLQSLFIHFGPSDTTKEFLVNRLYKCIKILSDQSESDLRREMQREALALLQNQIQLFKENVYSEYEYWHTFLETKWLNSNAMDIQSAVNLNYAIHREIANRLCGTENSETNQKVFKFFIDYFFNIFERTNAQPHEIRIAFRGIGLMAKPCDELNQPHILEKMITFIIQRSECESTMISATNKETLEHFSDYVQTLSQILEYSNGLSETEKITIKKIIVLLIRNFHLLSRKQHKSVIQTLISTFHNLMRLGDTIMNDILDPAIFQGIIWTCSHKLPIDVEKDWVNDVDWKEQVTFHSYVPLWNGLLSTSNEDPYFDSLIRIKIFDNMMETLFTLIDKLNLNTRKRKYQNELGEDQELFFSDLELDLEPEIPKDFHIFFNLVDFYCKILNSLTMEEKRLFFLKWLSKFIRTTIEDVIKHPLISGFMKLLQIGLKISDELGLFDNDMSDEYEYLSKDILYFIQGIITKTIQCNGELQISCIKLVLSSPTFITKQSIIDMLAIFEFAFEIERASSDISIAFIALSRLEHYVKSTAPDSDELKIVLQRILPCLNLYLQGFDEENESMLTTRNTRRKPKKIINESEMVKFQKRILSFLAYLQPHMCNYLLGNDDKQLKLVKSSGDENSIPIILFDDDGTTMNIILNSILPKICSIASTSTDRQKKLSACEIIHSSILYIIGSDKFNEEIWNELCQQMLSHGCDTDIAVQQMFEPLVMQVAHYMSRRDKCNSIGFELFLKCLIETVSHPSESILRDFSARCIRELLTWSIKQSTVGQISAGTQKIIYEIFSQINFLNTDLLQSRRNGACIAFNNLYRIFREEDAIITKYCFELLHGFCLNYSASDNINTSFIQSQVNLEQVSKSIDHLVRMIIERRQFFNIVQQFRVVPSDFGDGKLENVCEWLICQWSSKQVHYRRKMMEIFKKLVVCIDGIHSSKEFLNKMHSFKSIIKIIEGNGIGIRKDLTKCEKTQTPMKTIRLWLQEFLSAIECYHEIINDGMIENITELFSESKIFHAIDYFFEHVFYAQVNELAHQVALEDISEFNLIEKERLNELKCMIALKIFGLITKLIQRNEIPKAFWMKTIEKLLKSINDIIYAPHLLNFDSTNPQIYGQTKIIIESFSSTLNRHANNKKLFNEISIELCSKTEKMISSIQFMLTNNSVTINDMECVKGIYFFYKLQKNIKFLNENLRKRIQINAQTILYDIFKSIVIEINGEKRVTTLQPDTQEIASRLLQIAFYDNAAVSRVIDLIMNQTELKMSTNIGTMAIIYHGKYFFNTFKTILCKYFMQNSTEIGKEIIRCTNHQTLSSIIKILIHVIEYSHKYHSTNKPVMKNLVIEMLKIWPHFTITSTVNENDNVIYQMLSFLLHLSSIYPGVIHEIRNYSPEISKYILKIICDENLKLSIKSQAIFLLPCILDSSYEPNESVEMALKNLRSKHFPLNSNEFRRGTVERLSYENTFQSLLDALSVSKSPILFDFLMDCTSADENHIREHEIAECLSNLMKTMEIEQQTNILCLTFQKFCKIRYHPIVRSLIIQRYLTTMLCAANINAAIKFYEKAINDILKLCAIKMESRPSDWIAEQTFVTRIGAFKLLELITFVIPIDQIIALNTEAFNGKKVMTELSKKSYDVRKEDYQSPNQNLMEWFRKLQCAAYNSLLATVGNNPKSKLTFFEVFLFTEKPTENAFIWQRMINTTNSDLYTNLTSDLESLPKLKKRLTSIKREKKNANSNELKKPFMFFETQNIFQSSLSQDVSRVDMSNLIPRTEEFDETTANHYFLQKNSINDHEIMATICATIEKMFENGISPISEEIGGRRRAPKWVNVICEVIANNEIHKNIRIFLATVIDNCNHWFRHYARDITLVILTFVSNIEWHQGIDMLICNLLIDLIEWNQFYAIESDEEIFLANRVLKYFITKTWNDNKQIFVKNFELIKSLIEIWNKHIVITPDFFCNSIIQQCSDSKSNKNLYGFYLNAFAMKNEINTWTNKTWPMYLNAIICGLKSENEEISVQAAQIIGLSLKKINKTNENESNDDEINSVIEKIRKIILSFDENKMAKALYAIYIHYVNIVDKFYIHIQNFIPKTSGKIKRAYLEMFQSKLTFYGDYVYRECKIIDIKNLLLTKEFQLIALHIINKIMPFIQIDEINDIIPNLLPFTKCIYADCRDVLYEIMIYVRDNVKNDKLYRQSTNILINAITEPDESLRKTIFSYWSNAKQMPSKITDRFFYIFNELYDTNIEHIFLEFSTQILLSSSISHPEANNPILRHYDENEFKLMEYKIDIKSQHQSSYASVPLFMESHQKKLVGTDGIMSTENYLRETIDTLAFAPTIDPIIMQTSEQTFSLQAKLFQSIDVEQLTLDRRSNLIKTTSLTSSADDGGGLSEIRKRFSTNRAAGSALKYITYRNQPKPKMEKITLYRRYRYGDYPDFLINSLAFLLPLQNLSRIDKHIARETFIAIVHGICKHLSENRKTFLVSFGRCISNILKTSKNFDETLFGTIAEIVLHQNHHFNLDSEKIFLITNTNNMTVSGILLLEKEVTELLSIDGVYSFTSTSTSNSDRGNIMHWSNMANMYYRLNEIDIVGSIYCNILDSNRTLFDAIEAEAYGNMQSAVKLYAQALNESNSSDFIYQSHMQCLEAMGEWDDLEQCIHSQTDNVDELWNDEWNKVNLLPHYVHSNLRKFLDRYDKTDFIKNLDIWIRNDERSDYLKYKFAEDLAILHIANNDYPQSQFFSEKSMETFLNSWKNLTLLPKNVRSNKIAEIRKISEIHQYIEMHLRSEKICNNFINKWDFAEIDQTNSLKIWESLVAIRRFFLNKFDEENALEQRKTELEEHLFNVHVKLIKAALAQNNNRLAANLISLAKKKLNGNVIQKRFTQLAIVEIQCNLLKLKNDKQNELELSTYTNALQTLNKTVFDEQKNILNANPKIQIDALYQSCSITESILKLFPIIDPHDNVNISIFILHENENDESNNYESIFNYAKNNFIKCIELSEQIDTNNRQQINTVGDAYNRLATFCFNYTNSEHINNDMIETIANTTIESVFRSMKFGSKNGRLQFSRLLSLKFLQTNENLQEIFKNGICMVPTWMFFTWTHQILSYYDFEHVCLVDELVKRMAKEYPLTLIFPFHSSYKIFIEQKKFENYQPHGKVQEIIDLIKNPKAEKMINAFHSLCLPENILSSHLRIVKVSIDKNHNYTNEMFKQHMSNAYKLIYENEFLTNIVATDKYIKYKNEIEELTRMNCKFFFY